MDLLRPRQVIKQKKACDFQVWDNYQRLSTFKTKTFAQFS